MNQLKNPLQDLLINRWNRMPRLLLLLLLAGFSLQAKEKFIEFSVATAELPPYVYRAENKQPEGLFIDMLNKVQAQTGMKINVFIMPWGRAINEVKKGSIDAIMPTLWSKERAQFLVYPALPFYRFSPSVIIKRLEDDFEFTQLKQISPEKIIGKTRLVLVDDEFDSLVKQGKLSVYETTKLDEALLMLAQSKIDLVASDGDIALTTIKRLELEHRFHLFAMHKDPSPSYLAFSSQFAHKYDVNYIMTLIDQAIK
jgi:ABC-type amino acid transport substrate-binding protein